MTQGLVTGFPKTDVSSGACPVCNAPRTFTTWEWVAQIEVPGAMDGAPGQPEAANNQIMKFISCTRCGADETKRLLGEVDEDAQN